MLHVPEEAFNSITLPAVPEQVVLVTFITLPEAKNTILVAGSTVKVVTVSVPEKVVLVVPVITKELKLWPPIK